MPTKDALSQKAEIALKIKAVLKICDQVPALHAGLVQDRKNALVKMKQLRTDYDSTIARVQRFAKDLQKPLDEAYRLTEIDIHEELRRHGKTPLVAKSQKRESVPTSEANKGHRVRKAGGA